MSAAEVIEQSKARLESVLAPINGRVGDDVSYDEAFDEVLRDVDGTLAEKLGEAYPSMAALRNLWRSMVASIPKDAPPPPPPQAQAPAHAQQQARPAAGPPPQQESSGASASAPSAGSI